MGRGVPTPGRARPRHARRVGPAGARHSRVPRRRPGRCRPRPAGLLPPHLESGDASGRRARHVLARPAPQHGRRRRGRRGLGGPRDRLLEDAAPDAVEHGYLAIHEMFRHIFAGEFAAALEVSVRVAETGRRCRDANLVAMGLSSQGRLLIYGGQVREGLALLDEAMVGLQDPDVSPILAGHVVLLDGRGLPGDRGLPADGRVDGGPDPVVPDAAGPRAVHRAVRGAPGADHAGPWCPAGGARGARARCLPVPRGGLVAGGGVGALRAGEVLRLQGDLPERPPRSRRPRRSGATRSRGRRSWRSPRGATPRQWRWCDDSWRRHLTRCTAVRTCPPRSRCSWRRGTSTARGWPPTSWWLWPASSAARRSRRRRPTRWGRSAGPPRRRGPARRRSPHLRRAWKLWIDLGARYEAAWARVRIGLACRALGDEDSALPSWAWRARAFADIGAEPARLEVERLLGRDLPDGLTAREVEVLRLVASGRSNPQIAHTSSSARRPSPGT